MQHISIIIMLLNIAIHKQVCWDTAFFSHIFSYLRNHKHAILPRLINIVFIVVVERKKIKLGMEISFGVCLNPLMITVLLFMITEFLCTGKATYIDRTFLNYF